MCVSVYVMRWENTGSLIEAVYVYVLRSKCIWTE